MQDIRKGDKENKANPAFINDFIEICWVDPWAADPAKPNLRGYAPSKKKKKLKQLSGAKKKTLTRGLSFIDELAEQEPKEITIFQFPSKALLLKIMRACLGVKKIEDLWIYHDKY